MGPEYPGHLQYERNNADDTFIVAAARLNLDILDMSRLALVHSSNVSVLHYADAVTTYHDNCTTALQKAVVINILPQNNSDYEQLSRIRIATYTGRTFDSAWLNCVTAIYTAARPQFETEIIAGRHVNIIGYANDNLRHIVEQLHIADSLSQKF